jgi:hypothetical protein
VAQTPAEPRLMIDLENQLLAVGGIASVLVEELDGRPFRRVFDW